MRCWSKWFSPRVTRRARVGWSAVLVGAALGIGCVRAERVKGPNGRPDWWRISCASGDDECYRKAREICAHGFRVAPLGGGDSVADTQCRQSAYEAEFDVTTSCVGSLLVECMP